MFSLCKPGFMQHCAVPHFLSYSSLGYAYFQNSPDAIERVQRFLSLYGGVHFCLIYFQKVSSISKNDRKAGGNVESLQHPGIRHIWLYYDIFSVFIAIKE